MIRVLFVCHGNICRSTMAEFVLKDMVKRAGIDNEVYIESAATSTEEIGNDIHPGTKRKLDEEGVPYTRHSARQMKKSDYAKFDYLIGMDDANMRNMNRISGGDPEEKIYKLLDFARKDRSIADPWYTGNFDDTWDDVYEGCMALVTILKNAVS